MLQNLNLGLLKIHAYHHHVVLILNVKTMEVLLRAHVYHHTLDPRQIVDQNVQSMLTVQVT